MKAANRVATATSWVQLKKQLAPAAAALQSWDSCSPTSFPESCDGFKSFTMSEMLLKGMEEISLGPVKMDEQKEKERSFLLVDENESLQVCFC